MQENVSTVVLPDEDIMSIEYSMVIEPEYMVVIAEKEYQQVQVSCTNFIDRMDTDSTIACTTSVLHSSGSASEEKLCGNDIVSSEIRSSGLVFLILCHIMSESMCRIEISERERGFVVACAKLIPARFLFGTRHKTYQRQKLQSCFIDAVMHCARSKHSMKLITDLSVVRRDVVGAGFRGSKRARSNFQIVERTLRRHHANVLIVSVMDDHITQHSLGDVSGKCIGTLFWNIIARHVSVLPNWPFTVDTNMNPPWILSVVGGKRPKAKAKMKLAATETAVQEENHAEDVLEIIQNRLQMPNNLQKCMARTFRLFQCGNKASAVLPSGVGVCRMHVRTWRKHGLMTDTSLSHAHETDLVKYLSKAGTPKDKQWFSRDILWKEALHFNVDNVIDLSDAEYLECLQGVHQFWQRQRSQRITRGIKAGMGPKLLLDRHGPLEDYIGGELSVFKFFDARVFQEELRGIEPAATPSSSSERVFMLALQYTNNRMMNWVACRSLPIHERYAGPQYFGHRLLKKRLDFIPSTFSSTGAPTVRPRSTSPGWLCCDVCEKWRRVDADSLRVWDNRFFFEGRS
jgi:hypothetical protein